MTYARSTLLVALFALTTASALAQPSSRILGGTDAVVGDIPYVASVRLDSAHICGGSIIDEQHILTAAHCVAEKGAAVSSDRLSVRVGSINQFAGGKLVYISQVTLHPEYSDLQHDVAVLKLEAPLELSDKVTVIALATDAADEAPVNDAVSVAGWGEQTGGATPYKLQSNTFTVASEADCLDAYAKSDESTICLAHKPKEGSCRGDAGNGAVYKNKVVAVSNFVVGACGSIYPDVYSNVVYYAKWIESVMK